MNVQTNSRKQQSITGDLKLSISLCYYICFCFPSHSRHGTNRANGKAMVGGVALLREASPSPWSVLAGVAAALVLWWAAQVLEYAWWAPQRMERALRAQGLRGTRYRFLWGDLKEESRLTAAALARPVRTDRPHDVFPRVSPLLHRVVQEHGMHFKLQFNPSEVPKLSCC